MVSATLNRHCLKLRRVLAAFLCCFITAPAIAADEARKASNTDFFERRIRPILVEHCIKCHGPQKQESSLRLDSRQSILKGGDSGPAFDRDSPKKSLLLEAVRQTADLKMPPDERLSSQQIALFERWILSGLAWPDSPANRPAGSNLDPKDHWAFQPVQPVTVPVAGNSTWPRNDVDRFILRRQIDAGLAPSPRANARTLIRRATFDLTGLPPTPEEVARFEDEFSNNPDAAFASLINRLLDSPRYGERWGRYWLDVARYADNKGYVFFEQKDFVWAWTYRDWVIRAFNEDLPYNRFILEQLAADQLDLGGDQRALAALGFLTLGARFMNNTHDVIDDRIDVVTRGLMGLTVTCARCHDHKYDPIPQTDYYSLYGIFRSSSEPILQPQFTPPPDTDEYRTFAAGMQERVGKLQTFLETQRQLVMKGARDRAGEYLAAVHHKRGHPTTENFMLLTDKGAIIPAVIHRWESYLKRTRRSEHPVWIVWHSYFELPDENFKSDAARVHREILADQQDGESRPSINPLVAQAFAEKLPESFADVIQRYSELLQSVDRQWQEQSNQSTESPLTRLSDDAAEEVRQTLYGPGSPAVIPRQLGWGFLDLLPDRPTQGEFKKLIGEVEKWSRSQPGAPPRAMTLQDSETPFAPVVFLRGNPNREGDPVPRQFPAVLAGPKRKPFEHGSGRLELARAIVDAENPLTARVFVNRVWMHHFGRGLVETPADFGIRSAPPTHPKLLDWLTAQFITDGWSVKNLHRLIMNSGAYQQMSQQEDEASAEPHIIDPENKLLSYFPRQRLNFEATRDSLLAVSGALNTTTGGPPTNVLSGFNPRRTVYGFINRMDLPGLMRAFDFPEPAATSAQRESTTIAPQALFFLNHDFVAECARRVLRRADVSSVADPRQKIDRVYRILFGRIPDADEREIAQVFLQPKSQSLTAKAWSYGYGGIDEDTARIKSFTPLTHWTGTRWQAGPKLPDTKLGWVFIDRNGGHPASSPDRCSIRRWTSPIDGTVEVTGTLKHIPEPGNGVRGRIVHNRSGILGVYRADHSNASLPPTRVEVKRGDTIDFVVDWQGQILHDEHEWPVMISNLHPTADRAVQIAHWDSQRDFTGDGQDHWLNFVHTLLMTNEFVFVD